jgi:hypothetical protein
VNDDGLPHLRSSLRQGPALRIAQVSSQPQRLVEGPLQAQPAEPRLSFWQITLRGVPIVVAIASTALLAYFLLSERSQPFAQLQQQPQQQQPAPPQPAPSAPQQQQAQAEQPPQRPTQAQQEEPTGPVQRLPMPNDDKLIMLINSALIALNQANATGNYTVLRDMAAPSFQRANSPERLAQLFSNLRSRNLDLTPILLFQPKLYQRPQMNDRGMLRFTGFFPTSPERVNFDLIFQPVQGRWRLYGIAANTQKAPAQQAAPAPQGAPAPAPEAASPAKPAPAEVTKPAGPAKKPAAKPKPAAETEETVVSPQVDVRDRIDNPPAPPPAEKPKPKNSIWNPFGR